MGRKSLRRAVMGIMGVIVHKMEGKWSEGKTVEVKSKTTEEERE